jgi:phytoene dehydrogenase-like protein
LEILKGCYLLSINYDFIVIGGGICGMQISALCSTLGKVLVLEKGSNIGGRARVLERDGFKMDFGCHPIRFGPKSSIAQTLMDVGISNIDYISPGLTHAYLANGEKQIFPSGIKGVIKTKMIPKIKVILLFLKIIKGVKKNIDALYGVSVEKWCVDNHVDLSIKRFLVMGSASMQVNPFETRSSIGELFQNIVNVLKKGSVFYPRGGWGVFFSGLASVIKKNGEIRCNSEVTKIIVEDGVAVGIQLGNEVIKANKIVSTIPVQFLFKILNKSLVNPNIVQRYERLRPTAGICIDFCLSKRITDDNLVFFEEPPSYGFIPSNLSPEVAPSGKQLMCFFNPCDLEIIKDTDRRKKQYEAFKAAIFKVYPDIESNVEFERPLFLEMVDGVEIAIDQHRKNRPMLGEINIKNLYLTGDSIGGEGAGGDVGHTSVRQCFDLIKKNQ